MLKMRNHNSGRVRLDFKIPRAPDRPAQPVADGHARDRSHHIHLRWLGWTWRRNGAAPHRRAGRRPCRLSHCLCFVEYPGRGELFIAPGRRLEGMILGENSAARHGRHVTQEKTNQHALFQRRRSRSPNSPKQLSLAKPSNSSPTRIVEIHPKSIRLRKESPARQPPPRRWQNPRQPRNPLACSSFATAISGCARPRIIMRRTQQNRILPAPDALTRLASSFPKPTSSHESQVPNPSSVQRQLPSLSTIQFCGMPIDGSIRHTSFASSTGNMSCFFSCTEPRFPIHRRC